MSTDARGRDGGNTVNETKMEQKRKTEKYHNSFVRQKSRQDLRPIAVHLLGSLSLLFYDSVFFILIPNIDVQAIETVLRILQPKLASVQITKAS